MAEDSDDAELESRRRELRLASRRLQGHGHQPAHAELERIAAYCREHGIEADEYGDSEQLQAFEAQVAEMLDYPAARFFPSGTMAQATAVRIWADRTGIGRFGMHPTCHLELHEERAYAELHKLTATLVGALDRPMVPDDLADVPEALAALIVELPTRENGGQLAPWSDLVALSEAARGRNIAIHLDGARLWEAAAGYERPLDEICALFDSTYVSFYKGIGALSGSMLAGPADFVDEAKVWQRRHGGNLFEQTANWVSAQMRLGPQLARMGEYRDRARSLAAALEAVDGLRISPAPPQVNMFHGFLHGDRETLLVGRDQVAEKHDLWLFGELAPTEVPETVRFECTIGDAAMALDDAEVVAAFQALSGE